MEAVIKDVWKNCNTAMSNYKDGFGKLTTEIGVQIPAMNTISVSYTHLNRNRLLQLLWLVRDSTIIYLHFLKTGVNIIKNEMFLKIL